MSQPDDRELDRRVAKLPRSMQPERDLWTDIENRIVTPRTTSFLAVRRRKFVAVGAVSAVAAAAALALVIAGRVRRPHWPWPSPAPTAVAIVAETPSVSAAPPSPAPVIEALENAKERAAYRAAVLALEASLAENRNYLSTETAQRIDQSLGVLDQAIQATEQALARDPDSAELRSQLWDEYQQKIDALTAVVDLVARAS
jgi:tetratricopeptide (TPR) repeat protein